MEQELGQRIDRVEQEIVGVKQELGQRIDRGKHELLGVKQELVQRIDGVEQKLGHRIDRMEDRMNENHREVSAGLAETKAAVSDLSARLDERSSPRRLEGVGAPRSMESVGPGAVVREPSGDYSGGEPGDEAEPKTPKDRGRDIVEERSDGA